MCCGNNNNYPRRDTGQSFTREKKWTNTKLLRLSITTNMVSNYNRKFYLHINHMPPLTDGWVPLLQKSYLSTLDAGKDSISGTKNSSIPIVAVQLSKHNSLKSPSLESIRALVSFEIEVENVHANSINLMEPKVYSITCTSI